MEAEVCGKISFLLANETHNEILEAKQDGVLQVKERGVSSSSDSLLDLKWVGTHEIHFQYYLAELDPKANFALPLTGVILKVNVKD